MLFAHVFPTEMWMWNKQGTQPHLMYSDLCMASVRVASTSRSSVVRVIQLNRLIIPFILRNVCVANSIHAISFPELFNTSHKLFFSNDTLGKTRRKLNFQLNSRKLLNRCLSCCQHIIASRVGRQSSSLYS